MAGLSLGISVMENKLNEIAKFSLGQVVITRTAAAAIDPFGRAKGSSTASVIGLGKRLS